MIDSTQEFATDEKDSIPSGLEKAKVDPLFFKRRRYLIVVDVVIDARFFDRLWTPQLGT